MANKSRGEKLVGSEGLDDLNKSTRASQNQTMSTSSEVCRPSMNGASKGGDVSYEELNQNRKDHWLVHGTELHAGEQRMRSG